jgi:hypothetical protein
VVLTLFFRHITQSSSYEESESSEILSIPPGRILCLQPGGERRQIYRFFTSFARGADENRSFLSLAVTTRYMALSYQFICNTTVKYRALPMQEIRQTLPDKKNNVDRSAVLFDRPFLFQGRNGLYSGDSIDEGLRSHP